jgi:hypothetical protein
MHVSPQTSRSGTVCAVVECKMHVTTCLYHLVLAVEVVCLLKN